MGERAFAWAVCVRLRMGDAPKVRPEDIDHVIAELPQELKEEFGEEFEEECKRMFGENDADGSGTLELKELLPTLKTLWASFGCTAPEPTLEDCEEVLSQFDTNNDNVVNQQEFATFCKVLFLTAMAQGADV